MSSHNALSVDDSHHAASADRGTSNASPEAIMTDPYCFICGSTPGTVYLTASTWVCDKHSDGTGGHYMEGGTDD